MRYVILGSSAAGVNAVREIRKQDPNSEIVLVSKDKSIYSRCILHHYLGGERTLEALCFAEPDFIQKYQVDWKKGLCAVGLDTKKKEVLLEPGEKIGYDKLLIATGSHTYLPPIPNMREAKNVIGFRNLQDIEELKQRLPGQEHIVVMGAGLVGLDTVSGLLDLGIKPAIVEVAEHLLCKQLDKKAAAVYEQVLQKAGAVQYYGVGIKELILNDNQEVRELQLSNDEIIPCDYLIVTAGVRANVAFLSGSGVETDRFGLVFNQYGETNIPDVYGAGDVSGRSPIWPVAVKEGIVAGSNMAGVKRIMTDFFASKSTMNFMGIPTMSLGINESEEGDQTEILEGDGTYKKIIHQGGKIKGAILQGDLSYSGILQQLIAHRIDVSKVKKSLFEVDYSDFFHIKDNFEYYYEEESYE